MLRSKAGGFLEHDEPGEGHHSQQVEQRAAADHAFQPARDEQPRERTRVQDAANALGPRGTEESLGDSFQIAQQSQNDGAARLKRLREFFNRHVALDHDPRERPKIREPVAAALVVTTDRTVKFQLISQFVIENGKIVEFNEFSLPTAKKMKMKKKMATSD